MKRNTQSSIDDAYLLDFVNFATVKMLDTLADGYGKGIGPTVAKRIVEAREKTERGGFETLDEVLAVKGFGADKLADLRQGLENQKMAGAYDGTIRSRKVFKFDGKPPKLDHLGKGIRFEPSDVGEYGMEGRPVEAGRYRSYSLYYPPSTDRKRLFRAIESSASFVGSQLDRTFLLQTAENDFVTPRVTTANDVVFAFERGTFGYFRIHGSRRPAYPVPSFISGAIANGRLSASLGYVLTFAPGSYGVLDFDESSNRVISRKTSTSHMPTPSQFFDVGGLLSGWSNLVPDRFKGITLMPSAPSIPLPTDDREYVASSGTSSHALVGSNPELNNANPNVGQKQAHWQRSHQFRYVERIADVCIRSTENHPYPGSQRDFVFLKYEQASQTFTTDLLFPGTQNVDPGFLFDMYVFYGFWEDRHDSATWIQFTPKGNAAALAVDASDTIGTMSMSGQHVEQRFYVERGKQPGHVQLKTAHGKYLGCWNTDVFADATAAVEGEQFEIVLP